MDNRENWEPEDYLDMVVTTWLPRLAESRNYERALDSLASRFEERHRDRWLRDVLAAPPGNALLRGLASLAEAARANRANDSDRALMKSAEATEELRSAGSRAGALRADFEGAYALRRSGKSADRCLEKAVVVEREAEAMHYPWIRGQAILEQGNCDLNLGDTGGAQRDFSRALTMVRTSGYGDLELRAEGLLAAAGTTSGDLLVAWNLGRAGLAKYWSGSHSGIRGQQVYANLSRAAASLDQRQTAFIFEKAAAEAVAETDARSAEAAALTNVARLAVEAHRPQEAAAAFNRAGALSDRVQSTSKGGIRISAELYRAQAEIASGDPAAALRRLEALRPDIAELDSEPAEIRYQEVLGSSLAHTARPDLAEIAYRRAIDLTEHGLTTVEGPRRRAELMLAASEAYRGVVEILWDRGDLSAALRLWEWFRSGEAPGPHAEPDVDRRRKALRNATFLTYAVMPRGEVAAWLFDDRVIEGRILDVQREELEAVAHRFLRECADPSSAPPAIRRDGRQLYDWLVAPLGGRLDPARTLVIEPDGPVGAIPMQALLDQNSRYLGDRFAIAMASGLADYQRRESAGPVSVGIRALVVANPSLGQETASTFPPLAGTVREGQSVARRFPNPVLLTGPQATLAAVEQHRPTAGLFHFAGHGFSNAGNGGLLLSPEDPRSPGAGVLDGDRMSNQDWSRCRLAVLSACSAGTGEARGPVNPESLVRGLLWAGVARVVASRWNMDTETGGPFMDRFYTDLLSGNTPAAALQHAARQVRDNPETSHPYFWAGFQSFGSR